MAISFLLTELMLILSISSIGIESILLTEAYIIVFIYSYEVLLLYVRLHMIVKVCKIDAIRVILVDDTVNLRK